MIGHVNSSMILGALLLGLPMLLAFLAWVYVAHVDLGYSLARSIIGVLMVWAIGLVLSLSIILGVFLLVYSNA